MKQAAGAGEPEPSGVAIWRKTRYVSRARLTVRKLDSFHPDLQAAKRRTEALKQRALRGESPQGLLRIDTELNTMKIRFTSPDARTAQATVSRFLTALIDEYSTRPVCEPPAATVVVNHAVQPGSELDRIAPDLASPDEGATVPLRQSPTAFPIDLSPPVAIGAAFAHATRLTAAPVPGDCRDSRLAKWEDVINVLDPASLPEESDGPSRWILAIFGFFLGLGFSTALTSK